MIPLPWSGRSAGTGALRTRCIGCWTSPSVRMTAACATGQRRATWPSFARSLSTWSPKTGAPKPAYGAGARRLLGTTATCSRSSHTKLMREPCPGAEYGEGGVTQVNACLEEMVSDLGDQAYSVLGQDRDERHSHATLLDPAHDRSTCPS